MSTSLTLARPGVEEMVRRKQSGNPEDYFDKTFAEYQEGFSANGDKQQWK